MLCQECVEADEEMFLTSPFEGLLPSRAPSKKLCQDMSCIDSLPSLKRALHGFGREVHRSGIAGQPGY